MYIVHTIKHSHKHNAHAIIEYKQWTALEYSSLFSKEKLLLESFYDFVVQCVPVISYLIYLYIT